MIGRVLKYWQRLWKTEEMSLMGDASKTKLVWKTEDHLFWNELKSSWKTIIQRSTCNLLPCLTSSHSSFTQKNSFLSYHLPTLSFWTQARATANKRFPYRYIDHYAVITKTSVSPNPVFVSPNRPLLFIKFLIQYSLKHRLFSAVMM